MDCQFMPGQHVVLVRDWPEWVKRDAATIGDPLPIKGVVYTVREVDVRPSQRLKTTMPVILLQEIRCGLTRSGVERAYDAIMFRPLPRLRIEDFIKDLVDA